MTDRVSIPRLGSIRLKAGGAEVRIMPGRQHADAAYASDIARRVIAAHVDGGSDIAGFAFVVWGHEGASTCKMHVEDGKPFPSILAPDFVRNRLLAERIETWTIETLYPMPPKRGA